jgi:Lipocalin-like domain
MLAEKIIGVWELQIWETVVDDKVIGYPLGEKASGFIAYHPIGFVGQYFRTEPCSPCN